MAPTNGGVDVPQPLPVAQRGKFTEDYCRDDMAVFEVSYHFGVRVLPVTEPTIRSKAFSSVFLNVSSSPIRGTSDPYFLKRPKTRVKTRFPCPT